MPDDDTARALAYGRLCGLAEAFLAVLDACDVATCPSELAERWGRHAALGEGPWPDDAVSAPMVVLYCLAPDELPAFVDVVAQQAADLDPEAAAQT